MGYRNRAPFLLIAPFGILAAAAQSSVVSDHLDQAKLFQAQLANEQPQLTSEQRRDR